MEFTTEDRFPIDYKGFLFRKTTNALILNSDNFDAAIKIMKEDNIKHLEINSSFFKGKGLDFLMEFDFLNGLTIISSLIKDISPIQSLTNLEVLNIDDKLKGTLDFGNFKKLRECLFMWGIQGSDTIFKATSLQKLRIDNYTHNDSNEFSNFDQLTSLSLRYSKILDISSIIKLSNLRNLDLTGNKKLEDISMIIELSKLENLRLDDCKSLAHLEPINKLSELRMLSFNNTKMISSITHFTTLSKLEEIYFSDDTNIEDGDLKSLEYLVQKGNLKKVIFRNRRHYTHTPKDLGYKVPDIVANIFKQK